MIVKPLCLIFDLDNTLVDSNRLKALRDERKWSAVYARLKDVGAFPGITPTWELMRDGHVYRAVVTHAPRPYSERILKHVGLTPEQLVCYHDLRGSTKPSPRGYELATQSCPELPVFVVGDQIEDLVAADRFGSPGIFAGWSRSPILDREQCRSRGWHYALRPADILDIVCSIIDGTR